MTFQDLQRFHEVVAIRTNAYTPKEFEAWFERALKLTALGHDVFLAGKNLANQQHFWHVMQAYANEFGSIMLNPPPVSRIGEELN